jgi:hypothetical protein
LEQGICTSGSQHSQSQSGWIIFYVGCPVSWASRLQSQVALSTTEAEYIAMSQALHDIIPAMNLLQEMRKREFQVICNEFYVYCKVFEDNSGALELARLPKLCPRTKHINVCYHHFCEHVQKGLIKIFPIDTKDHQATKVRECYKNRVLWYLHMVLTYKSHVTTLWQHSS